MKLVSGGQTRAMYVINESGVYNVILRFDKPEAKAAVREDWSTPPKYSDPAALYWSTFVKKR